MLFHLCHLFVVLYRFLLSLIFLLWVYIQCIYIRIISHITIFDSMDGYKLFGRSFCQYGYTKAYLHDRRKHVPIPPALQYINHPSIKNGTCLFYSAEIHSPSSIADIAMVCTYLIRKNLTCLSSCLPWNTSLAYHFIHQYSSSNGNIQRFCLSRNWQFHITGT